MQRKLMEDPLVVIKKREMEERKRILDNPLKVERPTVKQDLHHLDADLNSIYHLDVDPDPSFKKRLKPLKYC